MLNVDIVVVQFTLSYIWLIVTCCEQNDAFKYLFMWLNVVVCCLVVFVHSYSSCIYIFK
jgi:hypothetical protein